MSVDPDSLAERTETNPDPEIEDQRMNHQADIDPEIEELIR